MSTSYVPTAGGQAGVEAEAIRLRNQARSTGVTELTLIEGYRELNGRPPHPSGPVLDLGGGTGAFSDLMVERWPGATIICADPSAEFLERAHVPTIHLRTASVPEGRFELVVVRHVFQHLGDADSSLLIDTAYSALAPGGTLIIVDVDDTDWGMARPAFPAIATVHARLARDQQVRGGSRTVLDSVKDRLTQAGFTRITRLRDEVRSSDVGLEALDVHMRPDRWVRQVANGAISIDELALLTAAYRRWRHSPDAHVTINVHMLAALK